MVRLYIFEQGVLYADIQTTMNHYAHKRMDKIEEAKETLKTMSL